ncbi:MAG: hypothetical protein Tsb0016_07610 [Sphingomonadales bacterium]
MAKTELRLWPFALKVYGKPDVAPACLLLQDRFGADVNILLYACWMAGRGRRLTVDDMARARSLCADWHSQIIAPARVLRRRLKPYAVEEPAKMPVYEAFKAAELAAEKAQQAMLEQAAAGYGEAVAMAVDQGLIAANAQAYFQALGVTLDDEGQAALAHIAAQAASV